MLGSLKMLLQKCLFFQHLALPALLRSTRQLPSVLLKGGSSFTQNNAKAKQPTNTWDADEYNLSAGFVSRDFGSDLLSIVPRPLSGKRILDLGCGDGVLTKKLQQEGASVLGVDASPEMISAAQSSYPDLDFRVLDAHALPFESEFDVVFSNAALHWMLDPDRVLQGVSNALKPGGLFIAECGGKGNVEEIVRACVRVLDAHGLCGEDYIPWYFPGLVRYTTKLADAGFAVEHIVLYPRPTTLPNGLRGWIKAFGDPFLLPFPAIQHDAIITEIEEMAKPYLCDERGIWTADYVRLRFIAKSICTKNT